MNDDEELEGEIVDLGDEDEIAEVEDTPDGGAIVRLGGPEDEDRELEEFYDNLADVIEPSKLSAIASEYLQLLAHDKEARSERDAQYAEGLQRTGMGKDAPGGAEFQGASKVVHPMLTEVCIDFNSRVIKELMPPEGPVKSQIIGKETKKRLAKARRKADLLNWQLTTQVKGFRGLLETCFTQLPLGGAQYVKVTWDEKRNRPKFDWIPIDHILLPFAATGFYSADRRTHMDYITDEEYRRRVKSGLYLDGDLVAASMTPEETKAGKANNKIEGRSPDTLNQDGLRLVYEVSCVLDIEDEYGEAPYLMTIDELSQQIIGLYRNWAEDDDSQEPLDHIIEFPFIPWRGAFPIGIVQMIGGLSGAATGALRALLDSAHIANVPSLVKLGKRSTPGQNVLVNPGEIAELEGDLGVDDIRKLVQAVPFNGPSATLFQLLGFLVDAGRDVIRTTFDDFSDNNQNVPVGTTLAKIEQGMVVYSAIHGRLHDAMARLLAILNRLNATYLDEEQLEREAGEKLALRSDFQGALDVRPVSDPNIFSEAQRFAQMQAVAQRAELRPQLYNQRAVEERILDTLKIADPQSLLAPKMEPTEDNAVSENTKAALGKAVVAYPDQDHIAHLKAHLAFLKSPMFGSNPLMAPAFLPVMMNHLKEHMVFWYADEVFQAAVEAVAQSPDAPTLLTDEDGMPLEEDASADDKLKAMMRATKEKDDKKALDRMLADASLNVIQGANDAFKSLPPVIAEGLEMLKQYAPPPAQDPALQAALAETQRRAAEDKAKDAREQAKLQADSQLKTMELQAQAQRDQQTQAAEDRRAADELTFKRQELGAKIDMNDADNATALEMIDMQNEGKVDVAKLKPANPNPNQNPGKSPNPNPNPNPGG